MTINIDTMVQIKSEFPNLRDFLELAHLDLTKAEFYSIMRVERNKADNVRAVELAYATVVRVKSMTRKDLVKHLRGLKERDIEGIDAEIRVLVAKILTQSSI